MIYELPPQVTGSAELVALRDYLVRLAQSLESVSGDAITIASNKVLSQSQQQTVKDIQNEAASLKALIIKNANEIIAYTDSKVEEYNSLYVAQSDFGNYYEQIETQVETTARNTVETYNYTSAIEGLESSVTSLNGQIRRGIITVNGVEHLGIAISENLQFTGTEERGGETYNVIQGDQTFGLYTASGWEFYIGGQLMGFFSAADSMLHVSNILVENTLQVGAGWQVSTANGFGVRYIGA